MNRPQRLVAASAGLAGMFLIGSLTYHPGSQAKGAYSTPVTVMNTNANSVPNLDTEKLARVPYQSNSVNSGCGASTCLYGFSAAPSGFRLVAEHLSGKLLTPTSVTGGTVGEIDDNSLNAMVYFLAPLGEMQGTFSQAVVSTPITAYVDSSRGAPFVVVNSRWNIGFFTLTGYLENCSITGCPAVQH